MSDYRITAGTINAKDIRVGEIKAKPTEMKFKANDYSGIDSIELNYRNDVVYSNGDLEDGYESVAEYLEENGKYLFDSLVECAMAIEKDSRVLLTKEEHKRLEEDSELLECLRAAGVDNWDGWDYAIDMMEDDK